MGLNDVGCVVADEIQRTEMVRTNVRIDGWMVMPNHVHVLMHILPKTDVDWFMCSIRLSMSDCFTVETPRRGVSTIRYKIISCMRNTKRHSEWKPGFV